MAENNTPEWREVELAVDHAWAVATNQQRVIDAHQEAWTAQQRIHAAQEIAAEPWSDPTDPREWVELEIVNVARRSEARSIALHQGETITLLKRDASTRTLQTRSWLLGESDCPAGVPEDYFRAATLWIPAMGARK